PATFQVTVRGPDQMALVTGEVTMNGPAVATEVTVICELATPPPPVRLSRAVTRKVIVRPVVGRISWFQLVLARILEIFGKYRDGEFVGTNGRNNGPLPGSVPVRVWLPVPRSNSSQPNVKVSPLGSLPVAVSTNGVEQGME